MADNIILYYFVQVFFQEGEIKKATESAWREKAHAESRKCTKIYGVLLLIDNRREKRKIYDFFCSAHSFGNKKKKQQRICEGGKNFARGWGQSSIAKHFVFILLILL